MVLELECRNNTFTLFIHYIVFTLFSSAVINAGAAGCCTNLALSFPGATQALLQSCLTFGAFSFVTEALNKQQPALAQPFSVRKKSEQVRPLVLPLRLSLTGELKAGFTFCNSLKNRKKGTSHPA
ncbi:hypothetical protein FF1_037404 [Malus domestica]